MYLFVTDDISGVSVNFFLPNTSRSAHSLQKTQTITTPLHPPPVEQAPLKRTGTRGGLGKEAAALWFTLGQQLVRGRQEQLHTDSTAPHRAPLLRYHTSPLASAHAHHLGCILFWRMSVHVWV